MTRPLSTLACSTLALGFLVITGCEKQQTATQPAPTPPAVKFVVTDTNQQRCFNIKGGVIKCPTPSSLYNGQDAQYQGTSPAYTDNQDGTVTDKHTGMVWQKTPDFKRYNFADAAKYCESLAIADFQDWRLPTVKELFSLADFRGEFIDGENHHQNTPYLNTAFFDFKYPETHPENGRYWSSSKYNLGPLQQSANLEGAFEFNFANGQLQADATGSLFGSTNRTEQAAKNFVRCVRGEENSYGINQFIAHKNGTVTDKATGLMWQSTDDGVRRNWPMSLAYAEHATFAGYTDWRLPNIKELQSIVKYTATKGTWPAIDTSYFNLSGDNTVDDPMWFWSSTSQGNLQHSPTYIAFGKAFGKANHEENVYGDWYGAGAVLSSTNSSKDGHLMRSESSVALNSANNYSLLVRTVRKANK